MAPDRTLLLQPQSLSCPTRGWWWTHTRSAQFGCGWGSPHRVGGGVALGAHDTDGSRCPGSPDPTTALRAPRPLGRLKRPCGASSWAPRARGRSAGDTCLQRTDSPLILARPGTSVSFRSVSDARRDWPLNQSLRLFPWCPSPAGLDWGARRTTNFRRCVPDRCGQVLLLFT